MRLFLQRLVLSRYAFLILLASAALLHLGTTISGGLYADDYVHKAYFLGSQPLQEKGLLDGIGVGDFHSLLANQFNFFDPKEPNYKSMMDYGMLPWWASQNALLHFYRPLATASHYLDYQWWPDNTHIMHGISLLWYLLGIAVIYAMYRTVGLAKPLALLAIALVILDHSMFQVVTWIASRSMLMVMAFGFFAVLAYHKSLTSKLWYALALLALLCAALSAEAVVAICAYLGAYMLVLDRRLWWQRLLHIVPFAVLILVWHHYYQAQGYGAYGVDFYIDPAHDPLLFLQTAALRLPANFFELASGLDVVSGQVRPDIHRYGFAAFGIVLFLLFIYVLKPLFRQQPVVAFFFTASCLSLIPGLTIALAPRVMIIPFVGFAVVLACLLQQFFTKATVARRKQLAGGIAVYSVIFHGVVSAGLAVMVLWNSMHASIPDKPYGYVDAGVEDIADKPLVIINAYRPFWLAFYSHYRLAIGEPLPASIRVLAAAFYPLQISRTGERELMLTAFPFFRFDAAPMAGESAQPAGHFAYLIQELMGLIRSSRDSWQAGAKYTFPEMEITVISLAQGKPDRLRVILLNDSLDNYRWSYWNKSNDKYQQFILPDIGQSVMMEGIFSAPETVKEPLLP